MPSHGENFITGGRPCRVSIQPLLASLVELLASALIKPLSNTCLAAQLGNAFLPPQAAQNNAYLDLGEVVPHGGSSDVFDHLLSRGPRVDWISCSSSLLRLKDETNPSFNQVPIFELHLLT